MTKLAESNEIWKNLSLENMEGEIWKDIQDYEGFYQISNIGRVKSVFRVVSRCNKRQHSVKALIRQQWVNKKGYLVTNLCVNKKRQFFSVHRLVANAFIKNPENKAEVNHKHGVKTDNRAIELEWNTHQQNMAHASMTKLMPMGEKSCKAKVTQYQVIEIRKMLASGVGQKVIADHFGVGSNLIWAIAEGKTWRWLQDGQSAVSKNRGKNKRAMITKSQLAQINTLYSQGVTAYKISKILSISQTTVYRKTNPC